MTICQSPGCETLVGYTKIGRVLCRYHHKQIYNKKWRADNPEKVATYVQRWVGKNLDHRREIGRRSSARHPEYKSIYDHHRVTFTIQHPSYIGMPFCDNWNPNKGGMFNNGVKWIIENIGKRPSKDYQLHVIDRRIGFMPNNIIWVPKSQHRRLELVTQLLLENQQLRCQIEEIKGLK